MSLALCTRHCCRADDRLLLEVGEHVPGPVDLERRDQVAAQGGDPLDQLARPLDRVERAGVDAPVLVHQEVGVGGLQQGVVLRRLDVPVLGVQDLPGHQGLVDGVGRVDDPQVDCPTGRHRRRRSWCSARSGCPC